MQNIILGTIKKIEQIQPDSRVLWIGISNLDKLNFQAGNPIQVNSKIPLGKRKTAKSQYTLLLVDQVASTIQIAVKQLSDGLCSTYLNHLKIGDQIELVYFPTDFLSSPPLPDTPTLFVATDTGISGLIGVLNSYQERLSANKTVLVWLLEEEDYFLNLRCVEAKIPQKFRQKIKVEFIAPVGHPQRHLEVVAKLEPLLMERQFTTCYFSGDGAVYGLLQSYLGKQGILELIPEIYFNVPRSEKLPPQQKGLRIGYTTGACSAAAAKAAARIIVTDQQIHKIESTLPNHEKVTFQLKRREKIDNQTAICSIIKDAGDDPDCTDGAELTAEVVLTKNAGIVLTGGVGVAIVTKAGLGLEVGGYAINPVPSQNIRAMVLEELQESGFKGAKIKISVPGGKKMAEKTINHRLGLMGGISILGTRGTVKPFSTSAYRASVIQAVNVAKMAGHRQIVITTGWRTEQAAMQIFPTLMEETFIQAGDFIGTSLRAVKKAGIKKAIVVGMVGKLSKMAAGVTMTHRAGSKVDLRFLADLATEAGATTDLSKAIKKATTGRHVMEICKAHSFTKLPGAICEKVVQSMYSYLKQGLEIHCYLVDFDGLLLAQYPQPNFKERLDENS